MRKFYRINLNSTASYLSGYYAFADNFVNILAFRWPMRELILNFALAFQFFFAQNVIISES